MYTLGRVEVLVAMVLARTNIIGPWSDISYWGLLSFLQLMLVGSIYPYLDFKHLSLTEDPAGIELQVSYVLIS